MIDVALAIAIIHPAPKYSGSVTANTEEAYSKIRWEDERPQPTWAELVEAWENYDPPPAPPTLQERLESAEDTILYLLDGDN